MVVSVSTRSADRHVASCNLDRDMCVSSRAPRFWVVSRKSEFGVSERVKRSKRDKSSKSDLSNGKLVEM